MPKKKQPHNAFYFFMLDYKTRCEKNGERFPGGLKDVQEDAGAEWNVMSASARKPYEEQAKIAKQQIKSDHSKKVTCMHNSFDYIDRQRQREESEKNNRESWVTGTLASLGTKKALAEHKFYVIHVNYFCISEGECYHPAELAIAEFSLSQGVEDVYHVIFNPGTIPLGYRHDAMTKSDTTHKIPLEENKGEKDYFKVLCDVKKFLERARPYNGGEYPLLFTLPDNVNLNTSMTAVKNVLRMLSDSSGDDAFNIFQSYPIYNLEYLFYRLKNSTAVDEIGEFKYMALAQLELEKDVFNYTGHIACQFHYNEDRVEYCSKSYVQRWVFLICDYCCQDLDIELIPGRHVPKNADVDFERRKQAELEQAPKPPAGFTWVDHSKAQKATSSWAPREMEPVPRPNIRSNFGAAAANPDPIDTSEDSFPAIPIGRGRGRFMGRGGPPGGPHQAPTSFASVMKAGRR